MKIFLAGATGAIGSPLIGCLQAVGHKVVGMVRSAEAAQMLKQRGVEAVIADALDAEAVREALRAVRPEAIINQLTALPKQYTAAAMAEAAERDRRVRAEGHANLLAGAVSAGVRRYMLPTAAFWYAPGAGLAEEDTPLAFDGSPGVAAGARRQAEREASALGQVGVEGVVLRYGFFYGPDTWYDTSGDMGEQVRRASVPVIGEGQGVWNFVHVADAAQATVAALDASPGVYNVVDDDPSAQRVWLPAFARWVGGPEPPRITEEQALQTVGPERVYYATRLRGASNEKAKRELGFRPRRLEWLEG